MQLLTERLFLIPLRPDGMRALLARTTDPELVQPYTDMLDLSLAHPDQWVWYTAWGLYQNDSGDWVGDLCFKGLPENGHPETDPGNTASQAVLRRVGFVPTGTMGEEGPRFILRKKT